MEHEDSCKCLGCIEVWDRAQPVVIHDDELCLNGYWGADR